MLAPAFRRIGGDRRRIKGVKISSLFTLFFADTPGVKRFAQVNWYQCSYWRASAYVGGPNLLTWEDIYHLAQDTCYIGISFYVARDLNDQLTVRASVAQAFDYLGQGLVLRGEPFRWNAQQQGASPHMTRGAAANLLRDTLNAYIRLRRLPPRRVVIHKTSEFWGKEHGEYNEREGIEDGIYEVYDRCEVDMVTLRPATLRLFREGLYPPLRGTYASIENQHFLYTTGFIPYLDTYPRSSVPIPWHLAQHFGDTSPKDLLQEVLTLTKMNVNNCAFADRTPITLSFAQMIGEIMKHAPEGESIQPTYQFYM